MSRLINISLILMFIFFSVMAIALIFFSEWVAVFPGTGFTPEQMTIWRNRTVIPAFYLTLCYFIYRYFSGKNPTSPIWPIYIAMFFYLVTQLLSMLFIFFNWVQPVVFILTLIVFIILWKAHKKRKNEIFGNSL